MVASQTRGRCVYTARQNFHSYHQSLMPLLYQFLALTPFKMAIFSWNQFINSLPKVGFKKEIWEKSLKAQVTKKRTKRCHSRGQRHRTTDIKRAPVSDVASPAHTFLCLISLYSFDPICCFLFALLGLPDLTLIFFRTDVPFISDRSSFLYLKCLGSVFISHLILFCLPG